MKRGTAVSVGFSVGLSMSILFSVLFCKALNGAGGIGVGICFGAALGIIAFAMLRAYRNRSGR